MEEEDYEDSLDICSDMDDDEECVDVTKRVGGRGGGGGRHSPTLGDSASSLEGEPFFDRDMTDGSLNSESVDRQHDPDIHGLVTVIEKQTAAIQQAIELFTVNMASVVAAHTLGTSASASASDDSMTSNTHTSEGNRTEDCRIDNYSGGDNSSGDESRKGEKKLLSAEDILVEVHRTIDEMIHQGREDGGDKGPGAQDRGGEEAVRSTAVQKGFSSIVMYIQKIIDNPNVSRYHRLSTTNSTFKSNVASLPHHEKLLEALGFQKRGVFWEWQNSSSSKGNVSPLTNNSGHASSSPPTSPSKEVYFDVLRESIVALERSVVAPVVKESIASPANVLVQPQQELQPLKQQQSAEVIPPENEVYSNSVRNDDPMKFDEIFHVATSSK
eukprot:CAMPEP_0114471850 /NCGR_PEP_ID=MMETSP0104-20121206/12059_1 /TAXON_ID=37642 ORGANISM="Paraphysomonas imperforata, Strain PA2" /NCGR_SAMPLE_ID=MMETSP0104 /ASSEMBLY_ACC=CAM_ASM_000202 /LENGTH=383 /DNA_ID=CAMNT_0001645777 /DNA_START=334 /DNA_END=1485 /DNA_ORIENTATION=+